MKRNKTREMYKYINTHLVNYAAVSVIIKTCTVYLTYVSRSMFRECTGRNIRM